MTSQLLHNTLFLLVLTLVTGQQWTPIELHDAGIDELDWKTHIQFHWNTPILTASSDPEMHPFLQEKIFPNLNEILKVLPPTDNRFGDLFNVSDVISLLSQPNEANQDYSYFSDLISMYNKRIASWMALYTRGQCVIDVDINSLYLLILSPGEVIPLHASSNFPVNHKEHESHDLISLFAIQPENFYAKDEQEDGLFIYDPRGTASGYGYVNTLIKTSQSEQLNTRGGYLHIFPSAIKFNTLPVDYTRVFLVSFAQIYSIHQPYRKQNQAFDASSNAIPLYHLQDEALSGHPRKNDEAFFDQNIQFFSSFGTPIFRSQLRDYKSLSVPPVAMNAGTLERLARCFVSYGSREQSVRKSNRNGWQSTADILERYNDIKWIVGDHSEQDRMCKESVALLYEFLIEQIALYLLSFSNSYYFDDNGLIINFQSLVENKVYVDVIDSWININRGIAMNVPHSHPNSDLSGVFYVDVPAKKGEFDGDLFFDDPRSAMFDNNLKLPFGQFGEPVEIAPQNGDVVMFPSWLRHWTMPTYTSKQRVSFAFNVKFKGIKREQRDELLDARTEMKGDGGEEKVGKADGIQILKREL